jgi:hypothetical protein
MANNSAPPGSTPPKYTPAQAPNDLSPQNINSAAPAPYQQFGNIAQIDPSYYSAVNADPFQQQKYLQQYDKLYAAGLQPTFNQQDLAQSQDLASRGITDSSAASNVMGDLYAQQGGQIAQGEAPMVQQAFAQTQQDVLANQAAQNTARQYGATTANEAALTNANFYNQAVQGNQQAYNQYLNQLYGSGANQQNALLSAYLNSYGPQTGVTNALGSELGGLGSTYGDIYGAGEAGQYQALGSLFGAAGAAAGGG